ncbi:MAG: hypothetical protein WCK47_09695 [bacterium]|nr:hypothetical protein [Candidatus Sumerlaeota bacterium]
MSAKRAATVIPLLLAACAACATTSAAAAKQRFTQDRFVIGLWVEPPADDQMEARYREMAGAGFNLVTDCCMTTRPEQVLRQLALCKRFGMKAIVPCLEADPARLPLSAACMGCLVKDEPAVAEFPGLRARVDAIRRERPGKLAFINMYPDYVNPAAVGARDYNDYAERFARELDVDVLCMDHYPLFRPDQPDGRDAYCRNLGVMRRLSLERGVPFWNFFNAMPFGPHTDPTEAQIRWQINATLAYGGKGVLYFCYWTPTGGEFPKGGAIITPDGRRTRHYAQARRINAELNNWGPVLMKLVSEGVARIAPNTTDTTAALAGSPLIKIASVPGDPAPDCLVGWFRHADGRRAVIICNYHFAYTAWPTMEFAAPADKVTEVDRSSGKERPVIDDSPAIAGLQLSLDAGDARLFLLPPQ